MTSTITIRANENGVVRVFRLDPELAKGIDPSDGAAALAPALGIAGMNTEDVQIVQLAAIRELGLTEFLKAGYDIDPAEIDPAKSRLDATEGTVAVVRSAAFGGAETTVTPGDQVSLIGTFHEQKAAPASFQELNELRSDSAKGQLGHAGQGSDAKAPSRGTRWGLSITIAFVLAVILFGLRLVFGN